MRFSVAGKTLCFCLSIGLLIQSSVLAATKTQVQPEQLANRSETVIAQLPGRTPRRLKFRIPNIRPSGSLEGGAARGSCSSEQVSITPLLPMTPKSATNFELYPASTIAARPKIFVYIPQTSLKKAKFTLKDNQNPNEAYRTEVNLTGAGGVVSFSLPADAPDLQIGKTYTWSVQIDCGSQGDNSVNPYVKGVVQRVPVPPTLANIQNAKPIDRPQLYIEADIWYDAINSLAELRTTNPSDTTLVEEWSSLLKSVNLKDEIANAPLL